MNVTMRKVVSLSVALATLFGCANNQNSTGDNPSTSTDVLNQKTMKPKDPPAPISYAPSEQQRKAISEVLNSYSDFQKPGITISELEVSGAWALATIEPKVKDSAEGAIVLMKNDSGWQILDYGTDLTGDGEKFGVPDELCKRWSL